MKTAKVEITGPTLTHERCQYRTPTGRQCAGRVRDFESSYCPKHTASQLNDFDDIAPPLTENASKFLNAQGINYSLAALYKLLASGRISPRRASTLAYISSLLLRSLNAIDNDPHPNAGKDNNPASPRDGITGIVTLEGKSASFAAMCDEPKKDSAPKKPQRRAVINGKKATLVAPPTHTRAGNDPSSNPVPQSGTEPPLPPGTTPMPATRKEFAQQVFAHLKQNESDLPNYVLKNPLYQAHTANLPASPPSSAPPTPPESPPA